MVAIINSMEREHAVTIADSNAAQVRDLWWGPHAVLGYRLLLETRLPKLSPIMVCIRAPTNKQVILEEQCAYLS